MHRSASPTAATTSGAKSDSGDPDASRSATPRPSIVSPASASFTPRTRAGRPVGQIARGPSARESSTYFTASTAAAGHRERLGSSLGGRATYAVGVLARALPTLGVWVAVVLALDLPRVMALAGLVAALSLGWWAEHREIVARAEMPGDEADEPFVRYPVFYDG